MKLEHMSIKVIVVGAGGFGREICDVIEACNVHHPGSYELLGVLDDSPSQQNLVRLAARNIVFLGSVANYSPPCNSSEIAYFIGVGSPSVKKKIASLLDAAGLKTLALVHPAATVGSELVIGPGSIICAGARLTTNIELGRHVHVNINVTIGHDTSIGDFVSINPLAAISGDVVIEDLVLIGASAFVIQGLTVGTHATVGASSCVTKDVIPATTVVGVPAKQLKLS